MINKKDFMLCDKITKEELKNQMPLINWKANIKFDGERIIAVKKDGEVFLVNRRGNLKNKNYLEVVESLNAFEGDFILDGEVITYDDKFNLLQKRALTKNPLKQIELRKEVPVVYMVFDILNCKGKDLREMPLRKRLYYLDGFDIEKAEYREINECLLSAEEENREGIIIKNMLSPYLSKRSGFWLKLKFFKNANLKIISYTENPAGIRCEDKELNAVQVSGQQHKEVKNLIDTKGYCDIIIQYLEQGKTGRYRFPSFVGVKNA